MKITDRAKAQLNGFERILHWIPGFKGYFERELRRDSDRLQREFMVEQLRTVKNGLAEVVRVVSRQKKLDLLTAYDELARLLERDINEIRYADRGYTGFFDLIKIREAELEAVYQADADLADMVVRFGVSFRTLAAQPEDASLLPAMRDALKSIGDRFRTRSERLKGYQ